MAVRPRYPGVRVTANGNQLVSYHTETRIADAGVFYPITPSTEGGELYQQAFAEGKLNVFAETSSPGRRKANKPPKVAPMPHSASGNPAANTTLAQGAW